MIKEKVDQIRGILSSSRSPFSLIMDAMRVKRSAYVAECKGLKFQLEAGSYDWFTIYENVIREDYFFGGINLKAGDTVVDIGANFGAFTAVASRKVGASGKVIAFEPSPSVYHRLERTAAINKLDNVVVRNEAVSGEDGNLVLFIHKKAALATAFAEIDNRNSNDTTSVSVPATSMRSILSSLGGKVDLLKIDCEGGEYEILESLDQASVSNVRQITMEVHNIPDRSMDEISKNLIRLGFTIHPKLPLLVALNTRHS